MNKDKDCKPFKLTDTFSSAKPIGAADKKQSTVKKLSAEKTAIKR